MQISSCFCISTVAAIAFAAALPDSSPTPDIIDRPPGHNKPVRISEVLLKMKQDLGELDWVDAEGGGRLLTIPTEQYEKYESKIREGKTDGLREKTSRSDSPLNDQCMC